MKPIADPRIFPLAAQDAPPDAARWHGYAEHALSETAGTIVVQLTAENGAVVLRVIDEGPGLTLDPPERAFDPFVSTRDPFEAAGLGLWAARLLVELHGGTLTSGTFRLDLSGDADLVSVGRKELQRRELTLIVTHSTDKVLPIVTRFPLRAFADVG